MINCESERVLFRVLIFEVLCYPFSSEYVTLLSTFRPPGGTSEDCFVSRFGRMRAQSALEKHELIDCKLCQLVSDS